MNPASGTGIPSIGIAIAAGTNRVAAVDLVHSRPKAGKAVMAAGAVAGDAAEAGAVDVAVKVAVVAEDMSNSITRLVYSTDPKQNEKCPKCKELISECRCEKEPELKTYKFVAKLRIEKAGRGGKTVTVIEDLPKIDHFLKELTTAIKKKCGTGGTYLMDRKEGVIEIQGDKKEAIKDLLTKRNIKFKG